MKINKSEAIEAINKICLVISDNNLEDQLLHIQAHRDNEYIYIGVEKTFIVLAFKIKIRVENSDRINLNLKVNFLTFAAIVQHCSEIIKISKHGKNILKINDCLINFLPPQKAPQKGGTFIPYSPSYNSFSISAPELIEGIKRTKYATSGDPDRHTLMGIAIHRDYISATDGHRLARFKRKMSGNDLNKNISPIALVYWKQVLSIIDDTESEIKVDRNFQTTVLMGDNWIYCEKSMTYPSIDNVIPIEFKECFTLSKSSLISALERCGSTVNHTSDERVTGTIDLELETSNNYFSVSRGENTEIIKQKQTTEVIKQKQTTQKKVKVTLNPCYLWDGLKNLDGDNLTILFNSEDAPIILKDDNAIALLMPVKRIR